MQTVELNNSNKSSKERITCHYCGNTPLLVTGKRIYPHLSYLHTNNYYLCEPCDAYVGCHSGSRKPLGILANGQLRSWKSQAHKYFDLLWKKDYYSRKEAYEKLAKFLVLPVDKTHIGMFTIELCKQTVEFAKELLRKEGVNCGNTD